MKRSLTASMASFALAASGMPVLAQPVPASAAPASILPVESAFPLAALDPMRPVSFCKDLANLDISSQTGAPTKLATRLVPADKAYCEVTGTVAPAIRFEVRLPMQAWTQRLVQTGCGGLCGQVAIRTANEQACAPVVDGQTILATTDMGHEGQDMAWGAQSQQREDFAHRGVHVTALAAKALAKAFYGKGPRYSYFTGCSDGGREALIEAQRHPEDFDGIAAGAPALHFAIQNSMHHAWLAASNTGADGRPLLTAVDLAPLHKAVLAACDEIDGLADGQIDDPRLCRFDPAQLACAGAYQPGECLTAEQIVAVRRFYAGAADAQGHKLEPGGEMPGSELNWAGVFVPAARGMPIFSGKIALDAINGLLFTPSPQPAYTLSTWRFDDETLARLAPARAFYDADNPDLSAFKAHGGKLILYHGWADPHIAPLSTVGYWDRVGTRMGESARDAFARLYMLPAMSHCSGGEGPSSFPLLAALMAWVESGQAPTALVAQRAQEGGFGQPGAAPGEKAAAFVPRSRPVAPYPAYVRYKGEGSIDEAASFVVAGKAGKSLPVQWLGED